MHTLAGLPDEVLCQILANESSHCVISLWKCGYSALNHRLERCITHLDLKDTYQGTTSRWPLLVENFPNLRFLSVDRGFWPLGHTSIVRKSLQRVSSQLHSLRLRGINAHLILLKPEHSFVLAVSPGVDIPDLDDSSSLLVDPRAWNIASAFPSLEALEVDNLGAAPGCQTSSLQPGDFTVLPQSLRSLSLLVDVPFQDLSVLPKNLEYLKLTYYDYDLRFDTLPPNLRSMEGEIFSSAIPKLLVSKPIENGSLQTAGIAGHFHIPTIDLFFAEAPKPLQWNSLSAVDAQSWEQLQVFTVPSSLTLLGLWGVNANFTPSMLPPTLKYLATTDFTDWSRISASSWPKLLHSLYLDAGMHFGPQHFHRLPRSLNYLCATMNASSLMLAEHEGLPLFEADLQALGVAALASHPQEVASLDSFASTWPNWSSQSHIDAVKAGCHFGLPIALRTLLICGGSRDASPVDLVVPPMVRQLELPSGFSLKLDAHQLPLLLEEFDLDHPDKSSPESSSSLSFESGSLLDLRILKSLTFCSERVTADTFALLPPNLTKLETFGKRRGTKVTQKMLSELPQSLTDIKLSIEGDFGESGDWIGLLPRGLRHARFKLWTAFGKNLALLPPRIATLRVKSLDPCSLEDLKFLPPSLTNISAEQAGSRVSFGYYGGFLNHWLRGSLPSFPYEMGKAASAYQRELLRLMKG